MSGARRTYWNFYTAGRLVFGAGAVRDLGRLVGPWGARRVFVVADPVLTRAGLVERVREPLAAAGLTVDVFDGGEPEPSFEVARAAIDAARTFGCEVIVGLGGGSNMDLAKIVAAVVAHGGSFEDYFGFGRVPGPVLPLACVPTTAGTGSEVSHAAVLTDRANAMKVSTLSQHLRPRLALVDPELTRTCPPRATADSGIDALTHAIEAYTAIDYDRLDVPPDEPFPYDGSNPLGDVLAEKAIALVGEHLVTAVRAPDDLRAREGMALAATLAGLAFSNCAVAVVHALEYPLGGALHCSHGAGNGLLLPYVMRYNLEARAHKFARVAAILGEDTIGKSDYDAGELAIRAVERLRRDIGIPERIRDLGGAREQLPGFAEKAFAVKRLMLLNPRRPTQDDLLGILMDAF